MIWLVALGLLLIIWAFTLIILKSIVNKLPKAKALSLQFLICAGLAWLFTSITGNIQFDIFYLLISAVGFINAFGAYCQ
jgi:hypothetical protein